MNPETPQPTQPQTPAPEVPNPQPVQTGFGAGQPAGMSPSTPPVTQPTASDPVVGQPAAPSAPVPNEKKGVFITLAILNILFFIPTAIAVFVLYNSYKSAAAAGDTVTATRKLKTMQIVGWIGFVVGLVIFVLYLLAQSMSTAP